MPAFVPPPPFRSPLPSTSHSTDAPIAASHSTAWAQRRAKVDGLLASEVVQTLLSDVAAKHPTWNGKARPVVDRDGDGLQTAPIDSKADLALEVLWAWERAKVGGGKKDRRVGSALAELYGPALKELGSLSALLPSEADFERIDTFSDENQATVEAVRSKLDGKLYVRKTMKKGLMRRYRGQHSPLHELYFLLPASSQVYHTAPRLFAAWPSPTALHLLIEFCPGGDLEHLLAEAAEARALTAQASGTQLEQVPGGLDIDWARSYMRDAVGAIGWCHDRGCAHRDIKPANFLISSNGHLKLCDFSTSAPFAVFPAKKGVFFNAVPPAAAAASPNGYGSDDRSRRRVYHYFCRQIIGTVDYVAPEVLEAQEERLMGSEGSNFSSVELSNSESVLSMGSMAQKAGADGATPKRRKPFSLDQLDDFSFSYVHASASRGRQSQPVNGATEPKPGPYGPEVDWWSLGAMFYEMLYGKPPFFADSVSETYQQIRMFETSLTLDQTRQDVPLDARALIRSLLSGPDARLGSRSSSDVQRHQFFKTVAWDRYWEEPAPFIPHLLPSITEPQLPSASMNQSYTSRHVANNRTKTLAVDSDVTSSPLHFSAMFPDAFGRTTPVSGEGVSSMEHSRQDQRSTERSAVADPVASLDLDCEWAGFMHIPPPTAFDPAVARAEFEATSAAQKGDQPSIILEEATEHLDEGKKTAKSNANGLIPLHLPGTSSPAGAGAESFTVLHRSVRFESGVISSSPAAGSTPWRGNPVASAPAANTPARGEAAVAFSSPFNPGAAGAAASTPFPPGRVHGKGAGAAERPFETPRRVPTLPMMVNSAAAQRFGLTPGPLGSLMRTTAPGIRIASSPLPYLRAGSHSAEGKSGGSSARRGMNENQAWLEMQQAILQSARKRREELVVSRVKEADIGRGELDRNEVEEEKERKGRTDATDVQQIAIMEPEKKKISRAQRREELEAATHRTGSPPSRPSSRPSSVDLSTAPTLIRHVRDAAQRREESAAAIRRIASPPSRGSQPPSVDMAATTPSSARHFYASAQRREQLGAAAHHGIPPPSLPSSEPSSVALSSGPLPFLPRHSHALDDTSWKEDDPVDLEDMIRRHQKLNADIEGISRRLRQLRGRLQA